MFTLTTLLPGQNLCPQSQVSHSSGYVSGESSGGAYD